MSVPYSQVKLPRWAWLLLALIPIATAAAAVLSTAKSVADATYVRRDTFNIYRLEQRASQSWRDSALAQLYRACVREGRCS